MRLTTIILTIFVFISVLFFKACTNQPTENKQIDPIENNDQEDLKALTLLSQNCFSCHNPDLEISNRIAPPMFKVRSHYLDDSISQSEFVNRIVQFVNSPSEELSVMPGAVRNFGLMPKQLFKEADLKLMAKYIFNNDIESDEWYSKWASFQNISITEPENLSFEDRGFNYASGTKAVLGKNLLGAIKQFGTEGAVEFCNTKAIPLVDSMSVIYNASIKRVSDKPRNPLNGANETEINFINELKSQLAKGEKPSSKLLEINGKMVGYYAIETNKMCLQCHGVKNKEILPETFARIKELYPEDKAIGYGENQIRGIWVVTMNK